MVRNNNAKRCRTVLFSVIFFRPILCDARAHPPSWWRTCLCAEQLFINNNKDSCSRVTVIVLIFVSY